jgi:S-DNA-T family DNA segregation ATPase FtsK/SpoIIIE
MLSHTLIAGVTGSGKSYCEHKLIDRLLESDARLFLIDPKRVELMSYKSHPHVKGYARTSDETMMLLQNVQMLMDGRYMTMESQGITETDKPPVYVVLDEAAAIMESSKQNKTRATEILYNIAFLGRAARVFLVCCTQRSTADIIPRKISVNLSNIVCLRQAKPVDSRELIGIPDACTLPLIGYAYIDKPDFPNPMKVNTDQVWELLDKPPVIDD